MSMTMRPSSVARILVIALITTAIAFPTPSHAAPNGPSRDPGTAAAPAASAAYTDAPRSEPVYSYPDAIRERVTVPTGRDSDGDGVTDEIVADIIRPRVPAGVKVPVIIEASPYYGRQTEVWDADGIRQRYLPWLDNYFVPRGYAVVNLDMPGTNRSTGCTDVGSSVEVLGTKSFIDWLNNRTSGRDHTGTRARADWHNGKSAMYGVSWNGTIANAVARTGVEGLTTIVPVAAISSWYDYTRGHGVPFYQSYMNFLHSYVSNDTTGQRPASAACLAYRTSLDEQSDDDTGDYEDSFWDSRNYVPDARRLKASVFVVHGLKDENVKTNHFGKWWDALNTVGVPRKLFLFQGEHADGFTFNRDAYVPQVHAWFDHWLKGIDNKVMSEPQVTIQREDASYASYSRWPTATQRSELRLRGPDHARATMHYGDGTVTSPPTVSISGGTTFPEVDPLRSTETQATFRTRPLRATTQLSGTPTLRLRFRSDQPQVGLTARLVDYGRGPRVTKNERIETKTCWGEGNEHDDGCFNDPVQTVTQTDYDVFSNRQVDLGHYRGLQQRLPLRSDNWQEITIALNADDVVLRQGHQLGLILSLQPGNPRDKALPATVEIDTVRSALTVPTRDAVAVTPTAPPRLSPQRAPRTPTRPQDIKELTEQMRDAATGAAL